MAGYSAPRTDTELSIDGKLEATPRLFEPKPRYRGPGVVALPDVQTPGPLTVLSRGGRGASGNAVADRRHDH